jgi:hypothetical protein
LAGGFIRVLPGPCRLRKDAALFSLPETAPKNAKKRRGPKAKYGKQTISLAKRAGHDQGWLSETFVLYREAVCACCGCRAQRSAKSVVMEEAFSRSAQSTKLRNILSTLRSLQPRFRRS